MASASLVSRTRPSWDTARKIPLEEPSPDDLGGLRLGRHHHRLAQPVQHLLEAVVVRLIFRCHLQLGGRDGRHQDDIALPARCLRQVVQKVVELGGETALAAAADVVHQLVHEDERRAILRQECPDHVASRGGALPVVAFDHIEGRGAPKLKGNLAPGGQPSRGAVVPTAPANGIELGADENGGLCRRNLTDRGPRPTGSLERGSDRRIEK